MSGVLLESVDQGHWTLTLNRPDKRNALNDELVLALSDALDRAHAAQASSLVLQGAGRSFCAGFDFSDFDTVSEGDLLLRFVRIELLLQKLYASPMATLAYAQGKNFGAGVDLFMSCQRRVAAPESTFRMPGLKFGLVLGTRRLGERIGQEAARNIQEVAATVDVQEALKLGMANAVAAPEKLTQAIQGLREAALALAPQTRADLYRVLGQTESNEDLAQLVLSVVRPGVKDRIAAYRQGA
ncbi:enoyl-CoA hydratase/isomerase family protein [Orrella sp. 11846]|uniref:enoyl-CoA hydratase/isomerase family protein n=1 Tax=Orrella sp. 11846 TaxID=3409913 RepID=UPI003B5A5CA7